MNTSFELADGSNRHESAFEATPLKRSPGRLTPGIVSCDFVTRVVDRLKCLFNAVYTTQITKIRMLLRKQVYKGRLSISDLDDAEQEAVCRLWIALIDGKFADILLDPHCQGAFDKLRFWLFGTVRNVVREFGRRRCWERALTNALVEDRAFRTAADTSNFAEARELLNLCGSSDASIIRLMLTDHTVSEAAQMLYINPSTVYRRLRALQTLAEKVFNSRQLRNFD